MIMIDVMVPPLDKTFDFEVDESISVNRLKDDVEKLICAKEKVLFSSQKRKLFLYRAGDFLKEELPLKLQGVENGDRMILI